MPHFGASSDTETSIDVLIPIGSTFIGPQADWIEDGCGWAFCASLFLLV